MYYSNFSFLLSAGEIAKQQIVEGNFDKVITPLGQGQIYPDNMDEGK